MKDAGRLMKGYIFHEIDRFSLNYFAHLSGKIFCGLMREQKGTGKLACVAGGIVSVRD